MDWYAAIPASTLPGDFNDDFEGDFNGTAL